jgi:hypothetical protein
MRELDDGRELAGPWIEIRRADGGLEPWCFAQQVGHHSSVFFRASSSTVTLSRQPCSISVYVVSVSGCDKPQFAQRCPLRSILLRTNLPPEGICDRRECSGSRASGRILDGGKVRAGTSISAALGFALTASCARTKPPETATPKPDPTVAQVVTSFVVQRCPDAPRMNSRKAETALRQMLAPCDSVPGGSVHFAATLMPGGRIELASPSGNLDDGVVPTCALKHTLTHPVSLEHPCTFDVRLEASRRSPSTGDAGPSAAN